VFGIFVGAPLLELFDTQPGSGRIATAGRVMLGINGSCVIWSLPHFGANINKFRSPIISPIKASDYTLNWFLNLFVYHS